MRVLVVDDTQQVRERLAALIADIAGVDSVEQAADGVAALALIAIRAPHVVVLDLQMPRVNGFGVLKSLRATETQITAIVVSNHADYRQHALQAGAAYFFEKATQLDALVGTLGDLAARGQPEPR